MNSPVVNSPLLTGDDLVQVTGKKQAAAQKSWLISVGIPFIERRDGTVVLTWPAIHYRLIGKEVLNGPDLSAMD